MKQEFIAKTLREVPQTNPKYLISSQEMDLIGVRDLVARGYFIPGGVSQRVGESGFGVPRRTLSDLDSGQSPVMPHRDRFWHWYNNFWNRLYPLHRISVEFEWA